MSRLAQSDPGLETARESRDIARYAHDQTVTAAFVVEVGAASYYDIPAGKQVIVTKVFVGCETPDEFAAGYLVACAEITGGGAATQKTREIHDHVGTKKEQNEHSTVDAYPPFCIKYSDGYRSVSIAMKATDNATVCSWGWRGWVEDEGTLS